MTSLSSLQFNDTSHYITLAREALLRNHLQNMQDLLDRGKIKASDRIVFNPPKTKPLISIATKRGCIPMVNLLLENGADIKIAISSALKKMDRDTLDYLLEKNANGFYPTKHTCSPLTFLGKAATKERIQCMESLIHHGAKINLAIHHLIQHYSEKQPRLSGEKFNRSQNKYRNGLKRLLVYGAGVDLKSLDFVYQMDVSGYSFLGVSLNGIPISKSMLRQHGAVGVNNCVTCLREKKQLESSQREIIEQKMHRCAQKRGLFTYNDQEEVNLVPFCETIKYGTQDEIKKRLEFKRNLKTFNLNKYSTRGSNRLTRFHLFILRGDTELVQLCFKVQKDVNLNLEATYDNKTFTCAELANYKGYYNMGSFLDLLQQQQKACSDGS